MKNLKQYIFALLALTSVLSMIPTAQSQIHQGHYEIRQNGVKVGEIFVPARKNTQTQYGEIWVVGTNYVYPSESNKVGFEIKPTGKTFKNEKAFLTSARELGGKIIRVDASEVPNL